MKKNLLLAFALISSAAFGQQTSLATHSTYDLVSGQYTNPCGHNITVYDDGGSGGNYAANVSATVDFLCTGLAEISIQAGGEFAWNVMSPTKYDLLNITTIGEIVQDGDPYPTVTQSYGRGEAVQLDARSFTFVNAGPLALQGKTDKPAGYQVDVTYTGDCTGTLYDNNIWNNNPPDANKNAVIAQDLTIPAKSTLICNDLTVEDGVTLTLDADATGYAMLYVGGSITLNGTGTIVYQGYLDQTGDIYGISSPMTDGFYNTTGNTTDLVTYNANTASYVFSPNTTTTSAGTGYFATVGTGKFITSAGDFQVMGTPVTSHTHNLGYSSSVAAGGSGGGWNLIGNPYTCTLDWSGVSKTKVNDAIYMWNHNTLSYVYHVNGVSPPSGTYAGSAITYPAIAPMQAFWVQATASGGTITSSMKNHTVTSRTPDFFKRVPDNLIFIVEHSTDTTKADLTWIVANSLASTGFDGQYDAWKMMNAGDNLNLFTQVQGEEYAINALDLSNSNIIDLGFAGEIGETYRLSLEKITDGTNYDVYLEDRVEDIMVALDQPYSFTNTAVRGDSTRFKVYINKNTMGSEEVVNQQFTVATATSGLNLSGYAAQFNTYRIIALNGQMLSNGALAEGATFVDLDGVSNTTVLVCLIGEGGSFTSKKVVVTD